MRDHNFPEAVRAYERAVSLNPRLDTAQLNLANAFRRLGSGWAIFVEAQRHAASKYPDGYFPDVASRLVDMERRAAFEEEGAHYGNPIFAPLCP